MSDYGSDASVENESYCMPSWQKRNVDSMNKDMGYKNMADRANASAPVTKAPGEKRNVQLSPSMPGNDRYNY